VDGGGLDSPPSETRPPRAPGGLTGSAVRVPPYFGAPAAPPNLCPTLPTQDVPAVLRRPRKGQATFPRDRGSSKDGSRSKRRRRTQGCVRDYRKGPLGQPGGPFFMCRGSPNTGPPFFAPSTKPVISLPMMLGRRAAGIPPTPTLPNSASGIRRRLRTTISSGFLPGARVSSNAAFSGQRFRRPRRSTSRQRATSEYPASNHALSSFDG
jgi:hypothetical protein